MTVFFTIFNPRKMYLCKYFSSNAKKKIYTHCSTSTATILYFYGNGNWQEPDPSNFSNTGLQVLHVDKKNKQTST